ncbi:MAG TPA: M1 family aminopeptidase [Acidimicrobiales bacterium]|nr:M1 family aminopeptidase [Acidimicrobiales bacterium]
MTGEMFADFTPDKSTDRVYMRLWPNGPDSASHGGKVQLAGAYVDNVSYDLKLVDPTVAYVEAPLSAGKPIRFRVHFTITLPVGSDDRLSRQGDVVRLGSWLPLLPWEPGVGWALDPPTSSFAEASLSVHADFAVRLEVPAGLQVLASGNEVGPHQWRIEAAPDWAAVIGKLNVTRGSVDELNVAVATEQSMTGSAAPYLSKVTASLRDLTKRYGAYPWTAYNLVLTPGMHGGIEYPGLVMQGPNTNERTTPHEVAHQWFYALVGNNQGRDPWLDEGLATWAEAMVNGTYASFRSRAIPADGRNRLGEPMSFWDRHEGSYYRSVYVQGLQALGALGAPTAAVDCALARYVAANAFRVATPATLTDALETAAPDAAGVLGRYGAQRLT